MKTIELYDRLGTGHYERDNILLALLKAAAMEHINAAYIAMKQGATSHKILYLLGGNDPAKCPFS